MTDAPPLGELGDIISVRAGHARNLLIPAGTAIKYSPEAYKSFEKRKAEIIQAQRENRASLVKLHSELNGYLLQIVAEAKPDGELYGTITAAVAATKLKEQGFNVRRNQIAMSPSRPVRHTGDHKFEVRLAESLVAIVDLSVLSSVGAA